MKQFVLKNKLILLALPLFSLLLSCDDDDTSDYLYVDNAFTCSAYQIVYEDNHNGLVDAGETVYVRVYLTNNSIYDMEGISVQLMTDHPFVFDVDTSWIMYGDVDGLFYSKSEDLGIGGEAPNRASYTFKFTAAEDFPTMSTIPFYLAITDKYDNLWEDYFQLGAIINDGPILTVSDIEVVYDANNNKLVNPGERVYLRVQITNSGNKTAQQVRGEITTSSAYVNNLLPRTWVNYKDGAYDYITEGNEVYGDVVYSPGNNADREYDGYYTCKFDLSSTVSVGEQVLFKLTLWDEYGNVWVDNFYVVIN